MNSVITGQLNTNSDKNHTIRKIMSDSDNDSDYEDLGEIVPNEDTGRKEPGNQKKNANGKTIRGPDKCWIELCKFEDNEAFKGSDLFKKIEKEFTKRKTREYGYADVFEYSYKFTRGLASCPALGH